MQVGESNRERKKMFLNMQSETNSIPEGVTSRIPEDGVRSLQEAEWRYFLQGGVTVFPLGGACSSQEKWLL